MSNGDTYKETNTRDNSSKLTHMGNLVQQWVSSITNNILSYSIGVKSMGLKRNNDNKARVDEKNRCQADRKKTTNADEL